MTVAAVLLGFVLVVVGVGLWSVPAALVVAGVCIVGSVIDWGPRGKAD